MGSRGLEPLTYGSLQLQSHIILASDDPYTSGALGGYAVALPC
jgi:hypothetical protein